jgi:hypothetical protein
MANSHQTSSTSGHDLDGSRRTRTTESSFSMKASKELAPATPRSKKTALGLLNNKGEKGAGLLEKLGLGDIDFDL